MAISGHDLFYLFRGGLNLSTCPKYAHVLYVGPRHDRDSGGLWNCCIHTGLSSSNTLKHQSRGVVGRGRRSTASTHFFVWNNPLFAFYVHLWPCESGVHPLLMASTHFLWRPPPSLLGLHPCSSLCQLIGGTPKFDDISDFILGSLYWLPIQQRMQLKTLSHMRKCFVGVV